MSSAGPRRLAVFDLDGTLTDTCALDGECFAATLAERFGLPAERDAYDWSRFPDVSHPGIVGELLREDGGDSGEGDLSAFEEAFLERLLSVLRREPGRCLPIAGALEVVERLHDDADWAVAVATGCFRSVAMVKLARAGFDPPEVLRSGDDSPVRRRIVESAVQGAEAAYLSSFESFESVVVLGDAVWDVAAAAELGLPCVGVGCGARAVELESAGAVGVLPDFVDSELALATLRRAAAHPARDLAG